MLSFDLPLFTTLSLPQKKWKSQRRLFWGAMAFCVILLSLGEQSELSCFVSFRLPNLALLGLAAVGLWDQSASASVEVPHGYPQGGLLFVLFILCFVLAKDLF